MFTEVVSAVILNNIGTRTLTKLPEVELPKQLDLDLEERSEEDNHLIQNIIVFYLVYN